MASPIGSLVVRIRADISNFSAGMTAASGKMAATQAKMATIGTKLTKCLTLPLVGIGIVAGLAANDMDKAMNNIRVGTGATGKVLDELGENFRNVMKGVPQSAGEISTVLADIQTRTGLTGEPLEKLTRQILNLGRITGEDTANLVRTGTRVFGDWSIATKDQAGAMDYLFKVSQSTGIGVGDLSNKIVDSGAPLRALGLSFEEAAALMGKWEKEGVATEKMLAGLRIGLGKMAEAGEDPKVALEGLIKSIDNAGTEAEANAIAIEAFGSRAAVDMARGVLEGRFEIDQLVQTLEGSGETINGAAKDTLKLGDRLRILKNKAQLAIEPLGKALIGALENLMPKIEKVAEFIGGLIEKFGNLPSGVQTGIIVFALAAAAIGPLLVVGAKLITLIKLISGVLTLLAAHPIILALMALVAVVILVWKYWDEIFAFLKMIWQKVWDFGKMIWDKISGFLMKIWEPVRDFFMSVWDSIKGTLEGIWNVISAVAGVVWDIIKTYFTVWLEVVKTAFAIIWAIISTALEVVWNIIKGAAETTWNLIKTFIINPIQAVWNFLVNAWDIIKQLLSEAWEFIKSTASSVWDGIKAVIINPIQWVWDKLKEGWEILKGWLSDTWNSVKDIAGRAWDGIKAVIVAPVEALWGAISGAIETVKGGLESAWNTIKDVAGAAWSSLTGIISDAWNGIKNVIEDGINAAIDVLNAGADVLNILPGVNIKDMAHISLAKGGIITQPTIALLGEARQREAVIPLPRGFDLAAVGGGTTTTINLYGDLSFPNVRDRRDTEGFLNELSRRAVQDARVKP